jgi:ABC-2 type transport system permease protein
MLKRLLNIERIKLLNYTSVKVLLGLHLALFILVLFVASQIQISIPGFSTENLFRFPHIWQVTAWLASWFNILLAIIVIVITCNEYTYRTFRQNLIDGLSRNDLFLGKTGVVFSLALYALALVIIVSMVAGIIYTRQFTFSEMFSGIYTAGIYFLQAIGYMYLGLLFANIFRNSALSIVSFLLLRLILEPILRTFFDSAVRPFFPFKLITGLTPMPEVLSITSDVDYATQSGQNALNLSEIGLIAPTISMTTTLITATIYIALFAALSWYILKKRDF